MRRGRGDRRDTEVIEKQIPIGSWVDVVLPDGKHRYWSTHCRHGNHADCKGSCKICGSPCICAGCTHRMTPLLDRPPVDGPARCEHGIAVASTWIRCQSTPDHDGLHISGRCRWRTGGHLIPQPADEPVSVPPPVERTEFRLAELVLDPHHVPNEHGWGRIESASPVPPPVDALLKLVDQLHTWAVTYSPTFAPVGDLVALRKRLDEGARALWAAGVAEGRRQRDEETHADVRRSAEAALAAFGPTPESVIVSYTQQVGAYEQRIYDEGIREGRRQATEERTEKKAKVERYLTRPEVNGG